MIWDSRRTNTGGCFVCRAVLALQFDKRTRRQYNLNIGLESPLYESQLLGLFQSPFFVGMVIPAGKKDPYPVISPSRGDTKDKKWGLAHGQASSHARYDG
jgi:hypothetical protein